MDKKAFTVIEMIVVIAIIVILAGFVAASARKAKERAYIAKAKAAIASLEIALSMYETDTGVYPDDDGIGAESCINLVTQLKTGGLTPPAGWNGPYMDFNANELDANGNLKDPWARPYIYDKPGANNTASYDLSSKGPDGVKGNSDDITNW